MSFFADLVLFSVARRCRRWVACVGLAASLSIAPTTAWAQRELTDIPKPDPAAELEQMTAADQAVVSLYASDPDFCKPIQINFDSLGKLWVASSEVYPQIEPGQVANDKIVVLEDTDGDGVVDKSTVFVDGLLIPTGVIPDEQGGAYVAASTELLHFADTDGDGVADQRRVVFSGFGTEDTHHLIHTLRWGPDGCLYFNQSIYIHSHVETAHGTRHLDGGGIWRYRPETGELSIMSRGFVNAWGHSFDAYGESFATDGAYFEGINYVFPDSIFVTSPGAPRWLSGLNPGSPKHCGLEIISGNHFPESWAGDMVTSDFRGHRVCRFTVRPSGTSYISHQQPELLTSKHIAFRPIDARMGPDGALYVADWYNPIIQHGEVDFRDERRDRVHGRIWRVHFPDSPLDSLPDFASCTIPQLIGLLEDRSYNVRQFARQHLWPKALAAPDDVMQQLADWRDLADDEATAGSRALEHQWMGEVVGRFAEDSFQRVAQSAPTLSSRTSLRSGVRAAGLQNPLILDTVKAAALGDDPALRLEAVVALGQLTDPASPTVAPNDDFDPTAAAVRAAEVLIQVAQTHDAAAEPVLDFALWQSLRKLSGAWVPALQNGELQWRPHAGGLAYAVGVSDGTAASQAVLPMLASDDLTAEQKQVLSATIANRGDAAALGHLLSLALQHAGGAAADEVANQTLQQLVARTRRDRAIPQDAAALLAARYTAAQALPAPLAARNHVVDAVGLWKVEAMVPVMLELLQPEAEVDQSTRLAALGALAQLETPAAADALQNWADEGLDRDNPQAAIAATQAQAVRTPDRAATNAARLLGELPEHAQAAELLVSLRPNQAAAKALAAELEKAAQDAATLIPDRARTLLTAVKNAGGDEAIEKALGLAGRLDQAGWVPSDELASEILAAVAQGDPVRGEVIYRRTELQCINCHAIGTAGGLVGPNLISLGTSSQPDYVLESLWLPDARLKEGYNTLAVLTDDGRVTSGIPIGRTDSTLRLRLADDSEVEIPVDAIEVEQEGKSLMPAGLIDTLSQDELVDLMAFLTSLGRLPEFTVSTDNWVRSFDSLIFSPEANHLLARTSTDVVVTENPLLNWKNVTTRVNASLPLEELDRFKQQATTPSLSFVRFEVDVPAGQTGPRIELPVTAGDVWVEGRPTPAADVAELKLAPGKHEVVVAINHDVFDGDFKVRLVQP